MGQSALLGLGTLLPNLFQPLLDLGSCSRFPTSSFFPYLSLQASEWRGEAVCFTPSLPFLSTQPFPSLSLAFSF